LGRIRDPIFPPIGRPEQSIAEIEIPFRRRKDLRRLVDHHGYAKVDAAIDGMKSLAVQ
jgi:hypothetical protein